MGKKNGQPEYEECKVLVEYMDNIGLMYTHIANETRTPYHGVRMKNKLMGVKAGFPDYLIIIPSEKIKNNPYDDEKDVLLFIEMKAPKAGTVSKMQKEWIENLNKCPAIATVCYGMPEAQKVIESVLNGEYEL